MRILYLLAVAIVGLLVLGPLLWAALDYFRTLRDAASASVTPVATARSGAGCEIDLDAVGSGSRTVPPPDWRSIADQSVVAADEGSDAAAD